MKKKLGPPHDATFRQFLANPDVARHLPAELRALCDLNTLKLESDIPSLRTTYVSTPATFSGA